MADHREAVEVKLKQLKGKAGKIGKAYLEMRKADYRDRSEKLSVLNRTLYDGCETAQEVLDNGLRDLLEQMLPKDAADKCQKMILRLPVYMYGIGPWRRSSRSKKISAYSGRIQGILNAVFFRWESFDLAEFLSMSPEEVKERSYPNPDGEILVGLIGLAIDEGDEAVINALKDIILSETNVKVLNHQMIKGIAQSGDKELHLLMKNLLLAARLQEGLRQAIFETADHGRLEYFLMIMETALEEGLLRYSSCMRAVAVWMGLGYDYDDKRVVEKILELSVGYLKDENARKAAAESSDVTEIYAAMWAESVYGVENIKPYIDRFMQGEKYRKLVALYFLSETGTDDLCCRTALPILEAEEDLDILAYGEWNYRLPRIWARTREDYIESCRQIAYLQKERTRERDFLALAGVLAAIPKNGHKVEGKPFPWARAELTRESVYRKMVTIAVCDGREEMALKLLELAELAVSDNKLQMLEYLLEPGRNESERQFLFDCLKDKSMPVRVKAAKKIKDLDLAKDEVEMIENLLTLKTGEIRQISLDILRERYEEEVLDSIRRMFLDKSDNKRLGALDLLAGLQKEEKVSQKEIKDLVATIPNTTDRERVLIDHLMETGAQAEYAEENGFGLYDPDYRPVFPPFSPSREHSLKTFRKIGFKSMKKTLESLIALIRENREYTFKIRQWDDSETEVLLGNQKQLVVTAEYGKQHTRAENFDHYPLAFLWKQWMKENRVSCDLLNRIAFAANIRSYRGQYTLDYEPWANKLIEKLFDWNDCVQFAAWFRKEEYGGLAVNIAGALLRTFDQEESGTFYSSILADLTQTVKPEDWKKQIKQNTNTYIYSSAGSNPSRLCNCQEVSYFINGMNRISEGEAFAKRVNICYEIGRLSGLQYTGLGEAEIANAVECGIVDINDLYRTFFRQNGPHKMRMYTGTISGAAKTTADKYSILRKVASEVAQRVIDIEVKRGDTKTAVSEMAQSIRRHYGIKNFVDILIALGNETLTRGYIYGGKYTKKDVLSSLLKASAPADGDTAEMLRTKISGRISDKRLLEAAMYAPAWIDIVEEYLAWQGLKSAAWYFHAHTSNGVSAEFETEVARFSPITREEFKDGAFDINWFRSAYEELGKERFEMLYDCAKYISDGAVHRRAQLFADAVLGKMQAEETAAKIADKRNKDLLLSYSLIPFKTDPMKESLERYEFIQNFLMESKKFGAQRRESEGKASAIAMENLARNLGFDDALRFSWKMEVLKLGDLEQFFKPARVEDCLLHVDTESMDIVVEKDGKKLKSVPAKLKKNSYVEELKKVKTDLKNQLKRAKISLEKAMENQDAFRYEEIRDLLKHPVIRPLIEKLVFHSGDRVGFLDEQGLRHVDGTQYLLSNSDTLAIAHSYHLYRSGSWSEYQRYAFENCMVQPFKQIFRELYTVNEDEKQERTISRRYAGHQVQPQKTVALLKGRSWTVDYDYGLQKVYYRQNLIATMFALADWFSPADIEAPTLETVEFFDRKNHKNVAFEDIEPVIFSETMRDVDLVVSVAHVGGVDPEASHSTIEMRAMILKEVMQLTKTENVTVEGNHGKITGRWGEYTVHLGSGMVHKMGKGALNILPVHSQQRGRLFLPFIDEDPKTAEILSKILMLAEDDKIKDPSIMEQIR